MSREDTSNELQSMYDIQFSQNDFALQKKWKEKLDEDERIKLQQQQQRGALSLGQEEPQEILPHAAVQGESHSYTYNENGKVKQATYAAIDHEPHVEHTMPTQAQRQLLNAASIGSSIDFMRSLGGHENGGIDVNSLVTAGKKLQAYAEANPKGLEKNTHFNEHYAVFCAAQHQKVAEYHNNHAMFFAQQAALGGPNQRYFEDMHALATRNMEVAKNDAAINMNIAQRWSEHGRVHELGQDHEPEHKIDMKVEASRTAQKSGAPMMGGAHLTPTYALHNAVDVQTPKAPPSPSFSLANEDKPSVHAPTLASAPPLMPVPSFSNSAPNPHAPTIPVVPPPPEVKKMSLNGASTGVSSSDPKQSSEGVVNLGRGAPNKAVLQKPILVQVLEGATRESTNTDVDASKENETRRVKPETKTRPSVLSVFGAVDPHVFEDVSKITESLGHASSMVDVSGASKPKTLQRPKSMESLKSTDSVHDDKTSNAASPHSSGTLRRIKSQDNVRL